jgi:hypothetical protein
MQTEAGFAPRGLGTFFASVQETENRSSVARFAVPCGNGSGFNRIDRWRFRSIFCV